MISVSTLATGTAVLLMLSCQNNVDAFSSHTVGRSALLYPSGSSSSLTAVAAAAKSSSSGNALTSWLPWNVRREKERQARRLQQERNSLYRQLGIVPDATYEEITDATNRLLAAAGNDIKQKVRIEVAKDKILEIRLQERMAGIAQQTQEARAMSSFEKQGMDDDDVPKKKAADAGGPSGPAWAQGLIVKPDTDRLQSQARLWGIITMLGVALPPSQEYIGRFTWLVCVAQLTFRGMPQEEREAGGLGVNFGRGGGGGGKGGHRKVSFLLGLTTWIFGSIVIYGSMPAWAQGQRWTGSLAFSVQNLLYFVVSCYLHPYKG